MVWNGIDYSMLEFGSARVYVVAYCHHVTPEKCVDELEDYAFVSGEIPNALNVRTVLFPQPVAPITLESIRKRV